MLNVGKIEEGIVLDHIEAGKAMLIYHYLHLDREDYQVAIIKNARSNDMGRKDILKVECNPDSLNLDAVAFVDPGAGAFSSAITPAASPLWSRSSFIFSILRMKSAVSIAAGIVKKSIPTASAPSCSCNEKLPALRAISL